MKDKTVSLNAVLSEIDRWIGYIDEDMILRIKMGIKKLPNIVPKRLKGHWINYDCDEDKYDEIKCSECGHSFIVDSYHWCDIGFTQDDLKFCPNCGVYMRG